MGNSFKREGEAEVDFQGFNSTCGGCSHRAKGTACQDYSGHVCADGYSMAVVSDGHGSEKHFRSDIGSKQAVEIAIAAIRDFMAREEEFISILLKDHLQVLRQLAAYIETLWVEQAEAHFQEHPCTDAEREIFSQHYQPESNITKIYGATLLIGVITPKYTFVIQTGDGAAVLFDRSNQPFMPPSLEDERLAMGLTTSLSDAYALANFRYYFFPAASKALFLCTDGVRDSYCLKDFLSFNRVLLELMEDDDEKAIGFLRDWLPKLSEQGSKDDMSLAGIVATFDGQRGETSAKHLEAPAKPVESIDFAASDSFKHQNKLDSELP
jgi:serine/threonine protein phosphatase PrpC